MNTSTCTEQYLDIVSIYPIPFGELNHAVPFSVRKSSTTTGELGVANLSEYLKTRKRFSIYNEENASGSQSTFLIEERPTLKSTSQRTVSGDSYLITIQMKTNEFSPEYKAYISTLIPNEHDLIIELASGELLFVRCPENAYKFTSEENVSDLYQTTLTFDIKNINGTQPIL